jgi:ribonucleoside-diphosphate reductase alpha chain
MAPATQFTDAAAAEAWDTWFRWRDGSGLRDRTIDATWSRVANAIAAAEGAKAALWAFRFVDAFSHWRLLPDERLLRTAGTGIAVNDREPPCAVLNMAAFVTTPSSGSARLDFERIADVAALGVRLLDDALIMGTGRGSRSTEIRIGIIGMAGALHLLATPYDSPQARQHAREAAIALANGTLRGSIELACERGGADVDQAELIGILRERETAAPLVEDALRWGVRHGRLTAIDSQPRLALLANNVSDALDPMTRVPEPASSRLPFLAMGRQERTTVAPSLIAQIGLRGAMQPWIDAPIDYPLASLAEPRQEELATLTRLANEHGLPPLRFRQGRLETRASADL